MSTATPDTTTDESLTLFLDLDLTSEPDTPCIMDQITPPHPADWLVYWECGCALCYCDEHWEWVKAKFEQGANATCSGHDPEYLFNTVKHAERLK